MSEGLGKVEDVLTDVRDWLVKSEVTTAVAAVKAILPIGELTKILIEIVELIRDALTKILNEIDSVTTGIVDLQNLLTSLETLLETAKGLAPSEVETINSALAIINTLKSVPTGADITKVLDEIIGTTDKPNTILYILNHDPYT